jgi:hypothetical protein
VKLEFAGETEAGGEKKIKELSSSTLSTINPR